MCSIPPGPHPVTHASSTLLSVLCRTVWRSHDGQWMPRAGGEREPLGLTAFHKAGFSSKPVCKPYIYICINLCTLADTHTHRLVCESGSYPVLVNIVLAVVYQLMFPPDPVTVCEPADTSSAAGMDPAQQAGLLQASSKAPESVASLDDLTTDTNK